MSSSRWMTCRMMPSSDWTNRIGEPSPSQDPLQPVTPQAGSIRVADGVRHDWLPVFSRGDVGSGPLGRWLSVAIPGAAPCWLGRCRQAGDSQGCSASGRRVGRRGGTRGGGSGQGAVRRRPPGPCHRRETQRHDRRRPRVRARPRAELPRPYPEGRPRRSLATLLAARGHRPTVLQGSMTTTDRRAAVSRLADAKVGEGFLVIGTAPHPMRRTRHPDRTRQGHRRGPRLPRPGRTELSDAGRYRVAQGGASRTSNRGVHEQPRSRPRWPRSR
jgi:hypothetical protein